MNGFLVYPLIRLFPEWIHYKEEKKDQHLLKVIKNEEEWTDRQFNQILDQTLAESSQLRGKQLPSILLIELN